MAKLQDELPSLTVVWRAFELRPEPVPLLEPRGEYLTRVWNEAVYPMAARFGLPLRLPPLQTRSRLAHQAAACSREKGRFRRYNEEVFRAFFERGEDIGSLEVLSALASRVELDPQEMVRALAEHRYLPAVLQDEERAQSLGLRGVPAFVAGERIATGVQTLQDLRSLVLER